jgi:hypothetical protein
MSLHLAPIYTTMPDSYTMVPIFSPGKQVHDPQRLNNVDIDYSAVAADTTLW